MFLLRQSVAHVELILLLSQRAHMLNILLFYYAPLCISYLLLCFLALYGFTWMIYGLVNGL